MLVVFLKFKPRQNLKHEVILENLVKIIKYFILFQLEKYEIKTILRLITVK